MLQPAHMPSPSSKVVVPLSTWVLISNFKISYNLLRRPDGTFNRHLAEFLDRHVTANVMPVDGISSMDVWIDRPTGVWGRIFWEYEEGQSERARLGLNQELQEGAQAFEQQQRKPLLIYFHGGSFAHSSANSAIYDSMCRRLVKMCKVIILSVNFRRSPENRYPCAYEDGVTSVRWAQGMHGLACLSALGCDPIHKCFLAGDSSGGNIAHNVAVRATELGLPLAGTILLMPMFGGQSRTPSEMALDGKYFVTVNDRDWYWRAFLPVGADRNHPACNPFSIDAPQLQNMSLPSCLVIIGGYDLLQDWQFNYVYNLQQAGKPVQVLFLEQATMGFFLLPNSDSFYALVERVCEFIGGVQTV